MPVTSPAPQADQSFVITRSFAAPRARVWEAWTKPELVVRWLGPKGSTGLCVTADLRPGGLLHWRTETQGNPPLWGRAIYREIVPPARLVYVQSFSDEKAGITRAPFFDGGWPLHMLTTVTLEEEGGGTKLTLTWTPVDATDEERATFVANIPSMTGGWGGSFDRLAEHLAETASHGG